ncbi:putative LRR receptor-like serine/threonine-protein kinase isoform X1 [Cinnamomum micranthum f. kanehirae]|uniref:Putative LRR receptor-like serine/threonine-protein kinase isoform X1 n=1 Tax=Cinnamomum micranthum f. kanehirae TaxID=337451 RepID=A0A443NI33_9MAGN|nr:putative LRR receptor-like serine/threonine-protein kinase isoform X1 [Cinnamomum micranthum f. kanehirae]
MLFCLKYIYVSTGFISLDCGIANDTNYINSYNIIYISDAQFIETGVNKNIRTPLNNLIQLYQTVRSFPNGNRNCYNLGPVNKSNKYLIRAYFMYGDYDGKNSTPEFDLYMGVNVWNTISFSDATEAFYIEIIIVAPMNFISVCLVNTGSGTPFISGLELRPLNTFMYGVVNESQSLHIRSLNVGGRFDVGGSMNNYYISYPEDPLDLGWQPDEDASWISFDTSQNVTNKDKAMEPPSMVMMTAVRPVNKSDALYFNWTANDSSQKFQVYMHFAELELLGPNVTREFTVCCGNNSCYDAPIRPEYLVTTTIQNPQLLSGQQNYTCSFTKTPNSNFPPILNAIEIFVILQLPTTPTKEEDGLKGKIVASLANIKYIQSLDLSWNNLTGPVPDFLGDLPFLSSLNLSGNQLSGLIPTNLIEKSKKGSLKLSCVRSDPVSLVDNPKEIQMAKRRYFHSNNLTQKSDIYGFGVVLLEMITGQPPIIRSCTNYEKRNLVDWARPIIATRDIQAVLDPRLEGDYDAKSLSKVAEIALACTSPRSIERPTMTDIIAELKGCLGTPEISRSMEMEQVGTVSSVSSVLFPR